MTVFLINEKQYVMEDLLQHYANEGEDEELEIDELWSTINFCGMILGNDEVINRYELVATMLELLQAMHPETDYSKPFTDEERQDWIEVHKIVEKKMLDKGRDIHITPN